MRILVLLIATIVLTGCASTSVDSRVTFSKPDTGKAEEISRLRLIGTWYGNQPTREGTTKEWITRRTPDGKFQVHFLEKKAGRVTSDSIEVGEWGTSYDYEIVITRGWLVDEHFRPAPADSYFWDLYQITHVDDRGMTYVHHGTGHHYEVRRVPDDFEFPKDSK